MKTKKLSKLSKILTSFVIVCSIVLSVCVGLFGALTSHVTFAAYESKSYLAESTQKKYNFDKDNISNSVWSPKTNYTPVADGSTIVDAFVNSSAYADITAEGFTLPSGLTKPSTKSDGTAFDATADTVDNRCLVIVANNAPKTQTIDEVETDIHYYFQSSDTLNLTQNSYFVLSFYLYTTGNAANEVSASLRLSGDITYETAPLTTNNQWEKYYLFFDTHADASDNIYVNLQYGNKDTIATANDAPSNLTGAVFFDNLKFTKINYTDFAANTIDGQSLTDGTVYSHSTKNLLPLASVDTDFQGAELSLYRAFAEQTADAALGRDAFNQSSADAANWFLYSPKPKKPNKLDSYDINDYYNAYNTKVGLEYKYFSASIVEEAEEFKTASADGEGFDLAPSTFNASNKILKLENKNDNLDLGVVSKKFTLDQFGFYRVSVMFKSTNENAQATLMIMSEIQTGEYYGETDGEIYSATKTGKVYTTSNANDNNWTEFVIYVRGYAFENVEARIALIANKSSTIYADRIKVERITNYTYDNTSGTKLDLSTTTLLQNTTIKNGFFNFAEIKNNEDLTYPLIPSNWTKTITGYEDDEIVSGITPTNDSFATATWGNIANPIADTDPQKVNVLGIYSNAASPTEECEFTYTTSDSFSIASNSVYKITFDVYTASSGNAGNFTGDVIARLIKYNNESDKNTTVDYVSSYASSGNGDWNTYTIYVRTASSSVSFKLALGISNATGTAFFRNVSYKSISSKTVGGETVTASKQFDQFLATDNTWAKQEEHFIRFVDFVGDSATAHTTEPVTGKDYFESKNYSVEEKKDSDNNIVSGEIVIAKNNAPVTVGSYNLTTADLTRTNAKTDSVLILFNDGERYSTATPKYSFSLTSNLYYRISVWVKTNAEVGDNFTINFKNVDTTFEQVLTDTTENDGFVEYVAYVKAGNSSISNVQIQFILGTSDSKTAGYVIINDIAADEITSAQFTGATADLTGDEPNVQVHNYTTPKDESTSTDTETQTDAEKNNTSLVIFFVVFSSILTVAALVIALVSISIKKLRRTPKVVGKNNANVSIKQTGTNNQTNGKDGFV